MAGRPTKYTKALGTTICQRIAEGESLRSICKDEGIPAISTIMKWILEDDKKDFSEQYEKACNARAENMFEELIEIADEGGEVNRDRLRVDTRKWYLSKLAPKKFGEKIDLTSGGKPLLIAEDDE